MDEPMSLEPASALENGDLEVSLRKAIKSRANFIREQAESITLERLRRLLEKDLEKEAFELDSCKRLIKHLVDEVLSSDKQTQVLNGADGHTNDDTSETAVKKEGEECIDGSEGQERAEVEKKEEPRDEDSSKVVVVESVKEKDVETSVREAISKRASYLRENSENITLQQVRRLLEADIGLQEFELDKQKQLIKKLVDEVLHTSEETLEEPTKGKKRKEQKDEKSEVHASTNGEKKSGGQKKKARKDDERNEELENDEDNYSEKSFAKKSKVLSKKTAETKQAYSKHVERLRQTIKACGLSISPNIYRKVKQAPEQKRGEVLEKELEAILSREGLSVNASEKEIKAARRRRERQKDLEDIDTKNIITEPRGRRQASLFFAPPVYKQPEESQTSSEEEDENGASANEDELPPVEDELVEDSE